MTIAAHKQYSAIEMADAIKLVFELHGGDLPTVICSIYLELTERCEQLEMKIAKLELKKK